ncbi:MAG: nitroreductase family protein [Candidatus Omnitrophota bacterium]
MNILRLIKKRRSSRRYENRPVSPKLINKIIEAGIWGPSLLAPGFQPWIFILLREKTFIKEISNIMFEKAERMNILASRILRFSAYTIASAPVVILVYSSSVLSRFTGKIDKMFVRYARDAELAAISAAIQNMLLTAESIGIGSNWHDTPLFCEKEINQLLNVHNKLIAVLTFGVSSEGGRRSPRKPYIEAVKYLR